MHCPNCRAEYTGEDLYCRQCGMEVEPTTRSIVPTRTSLPAILYHSPVPRRVAAGVGALALGVGIELLRRNVLPRLSSPQTRKRGVSSAVDVKDLLFPSQEKVVKLPKGYEIHETAVYVRRVIRRER